MRLARADTGTPVLGWLKMPLTELYEWVNVVSDESEKSQQELKKKQK